MTIKQPKKLNREQKACLSARGLKTDNWMLVEETAFYLKIINKKTGRRKMVDKLGGISGDYYRLQQVEH